MNIELPTVIAAFFQLTNTREFANFLQLFTDDAHVNDEANDYFGAQIADWINHATADAKPTADVVDITRDRDQFVVTAQISGNFQEAQYSFVTTLLSRIPKLLRCSSKHEPWLPTKKLPASARNTIHGKVYVFSTPSTSRTCLTVRSTRTSMLRMAAG